MKLSFIVSTYKRSENLRGLFSSLLVQSDPNWECIIMDEGDNIQMLPNDPRFKYHKFERIELGFDNLGRGSLGLLAKDAGIQFASGEFIVFANDDVYFLPLFVEILTSEQIRTGSDLELCDFVFACPGYQNRVISAYPQVGSICTSNYILRKSVIGGVKFANFLTKEWYGVADGLFIEKLISQGIKHHKTDRGIFVVYN